ncbi:hypothetical protein AMECASPLE_023426 [Ameca splendens]|uniref:Uncharacterized protein n=1 Tax=Ameca splendens TaxID=208324 RepID=A0ABV0XH39_9TELE
MEVNGSQHMVLTTYSKTRVCVCVCVCVYVFMQDNRLSLSLFLRLNNDNQILAPNIRMLHLLTNSYQCQISKNWEAGCLMFIGSLLLLQSKQMHVRLVGISGLPLGVNVCMNGCLPHVDSLW